MQRPKAKPVEVGAPRLMRAALSSRLGALITNWTFQGMRYMQWQERCLKLGSDLVLAGLLLLAFGSLTPLSVLSALVLAHSCNWLLNGHFFVLVRYLHPIPNALTRFDEYVARVHAEAERNAAVDGLAVFGSYCRGAIHEHSDLDLRVISRPGLGSSLRAAWFCMRLRCVAFFRRFPLDIYAFDDIAYLDRLREDERPIILMDRSGRLGARYG